MMLTNRPERSRPLRNGVTIKSDIRNTAEVAFARVLPVFDALPRPTVEVFKRIAVRVRPKLSPPVGAKFGSRVELVERPGGSRVRLTAANCNGGPSSKIWTGAATNNSFEMVQRTALLMVKRRVTNVRTVEKPTIPTHRRLARVWMVAASVLAGVVAGAPLALTTAASAEEMKFASPRAAYNQGIGAFKRGQYEIAIPALEAAQDAGSFFAPYVLAQIYSGDNPAYIDHKKALKLYEGIVARYAHRVDGDDVSRAPIVAKALTEMAKYIYRGLPEANVIADPKRAIRYLTHAAEHFNEKDAQFELARLHLMAGDERSVRHGLNWMNELVKSGHPGATATMADLFWRGKFVQRNALHALSLAAQARKYAPTNEKLWIEDIYQRVFCGASPYVRKQAAGLVARWSGRLGPNWPRGALKRKTLPDLGSVGPVRTCSNGEAVRGLEDAIRDNRGENRVEAKPLSVEATTPRTRSDVGADAAMDNAESSRTRSAEASDETPPLGAISPAGMQLIEPVPDQSR